MSALDATVTLRDVLRIVTLVRETRPRDGLRAVEDAVLDLAGRCEG